MTENNKNQQPGKPPMRGRDSFERAQRAMGDVAIAAHADIQEVAVFGDWAYCWNHLTVTMTPQGAAPLKRAGNVLSVLRKQNGRWMIFRDANLLTRVDS